MLVDRLVGTNRWASIWAGLVNLMAIPLIAPPVASVAIADPVTISYHNSFAVPLGRWSERRDPAAEMPIRASSAGRVTMAAAVGRRVELLTDIDGVVSRPVRKIVLLDG